MFFVVSDELLLLSLVVLSAVQPEKDMKIIKAKSNINIFFNKITSYFYYIDLQINFNRYAKIPVDCSTGICYAL